MTLRILPDLIQGTEEWYDQRRGMVTASAVGQLVTTKTLAAASNDYSRALTTLLVAERITGRTDPTFTNADMFRGIEEEPRARALYSETYAPATECGFMVRDDWGYNIGFSPDGLVGDDGLLEVKAPRAKKHIQTVLADEVPVEHMAQLQCGLLVSGRSWVDFVSFVGGLPMWTKRVEPDEKWFAAIVAAVEAFEVAAFEMVADFERLTEGLPVPECLDLELVI